MPATPQSIWADRSLDAAMRRANTQAPSRRKREVEPASLRAAVDGRESGPPLETYRREGDMGEARDLADRLTDAVMTLKDLKAVAACYSDNAVAVTPDRGQITGRDGIVEYLGQFIEAFPDAQFEYLAKHESGNVAIDEGCLSHVALPAVCLQRRPRFPIVNGCPERCWFDLALPARRGLSLDPPLIMAAGCS